MVLRSGTNERNKRIRKKDFYQQLKFFYFPTIMAKSRKIQKFGGDGKLVAELTVGYRRSGCVRRRITCSGDTMALIKGTFADWDLDTHVERFHVILLNRANKPIAYQLISQGGLSGTVMDARTIMQIAVEFQVCSMILVHNHPSGNNTPSQADIQLTRNIADAGKLLDVTVLDHIIYAPNDKGDDFNFYSFADDGLL